MISFNALKVLSASEIYYGPLIMSSWYCGIKKFSLWIAALLLALALEWREKSRGKEEGERRVSSPSLPVPNAFFFLLFLLGRPHYLNVSGASRLVCGRK